MISIIIVHLLCFFVLKECFNFRSKIIFAKKSENVSQFLSFRGKLEECKDSKRLKNVIDFFISISLLLYIIIFWIVYYNFTEFFKEHEVTTIFLFGSILFGTLFVQVKRHHYFRKFEDNCTKKICDLKDSSYKFYLKEVKKTFLGKICIFIVSIY